MKLIKYTILLLSTSLILINAREIRHISPPQITQNHAGKCIVCYRPFRQDGPNMSIELHDNKVITHNYGHGGSGWTLAPGATSYVNNLLLSSSLADDLDFQTPITIIGTGVFGLFTAYDLTQKGFTNLTIVADQFSGLASHNAGGLFALAAMNNTPEIQKIITKNGVDSYKFYLSVAQNKHPHFSPNGAKVLPLYTNNKEKSGLELFVNKVIQPAKEVEIDFGNGITHQLFAYDDGMYIDTHVLIDELFSFLESTGTKFVKRRINNFSDINSKYIINCSGLGAEKLNSDDKMQAIQGHLITISNQTPSGLEYMIRIEPEAPTHRSFYFFPKHLKGTAENDIGIIGGTFIPGTAKPTPNGKEFQLELLKGIEENDFSTTKDICATKTIQYSSDENESELTVKRAKKFFGL